MKLRSYLVIGTLGLAGGVFAVSGLFMGYSPVQTATFFLAPSTDELCEIGDPIVNQLRKYYVQNGMYPSTLADAGLEAGDTFVGPWEYQPMDNGTSCQLSNGNYARYLFVVFWTPAHGWYIDT